MFLGWARYLGATSVMTTAFVAKVVDEELRVDLAHGSSQNVGS